MKSHTNKGVVSVVAAALIVAVMATSFAAGVNLGQRNNQQFVINGAAVPQNAQQPLNDLWQAYQHLATDSYWRPFDQKQLLYNAVSGLLTLPQDTHTSFSPPAERQVQSQKLNEGLDGIGAQVTMIAGSGLVIDAPYFDSPAMRAGLQAGDIIVAVDGRDIRRMSADSAVALIHGHAGTIVKLSVLRPGRPTAHIVSVVRGAIPTVIISTSGQVGYLEFSEFGSNTASEVHAALAKLLSEHVKYLVLDLRDNPGGYVDAARAIASEFLPKGKVIWWDRTNLGANKYSEVANEVTTPGIAQHLPVVVLVDAYTASAAEILTAALRENGRAHVVGVQTYGKGSEQESITLDDGSGLLITTTLWLTPQKHEVNGKGITPDFVVQRPNANQDPQLQRAIQYLVTGH